MFPHIYMYTYSCIRAIQQFVTLFFPQIYSIFCWEVFFPSNTERDKGKRSFACFKHRFLKTKVRLQVPTFYCNPHHHHVVPLARISLTISHHFSLSFIASGRSSGLHPISSHSCWMYVRAGRPAFARPYVGVHGSTSLMSSSLLLQQCPACLVRLAWIVFVMRGRWPYSWCLVKLLPPGLVQYCSQHSCVIAV